MFRADAAASRIISLLPSATEIVCALGAGESLVGISHECDFPEAIRDRPRSRTPLDGSYASSNCIGDGMNVCVATDLIVVGIKPAGDSGQAGNQCADVRTQLATGDAGRHREIQLPDDVGDGAITEQGHPDDDPHDLVRR